MPLCKIWKSAHTKKLFYIHPNNVVLNFAEFWKYLKNHEFYWILNVQVRNYQSGGGGIRHSLQLGSGLTSAKLLHGCCAADASPTLRHHPSSSGIRIANRPFGHQRRCTKRLTIIASMWDRQTRRRGSNCVDSDNTRSHHTAPTSQERRSKFYLPNKSSFLTTTDMATRWTENRKHVSDECRGNEQSSS